MYPLWVNTKAHENPKELSLTGFAGINMRTKIRALIFVRILMPAKPVSDNSLGFSWAFVFTHSGYMSGAKVQKIRQKLEFHSNLNPLAVYI